MVSKHEQEIFFLKQTDPVSGVSEDAADLESIELVANEVLAMQMPTTPAQLQNLTDEIRQKVGELGGVESILQQSADDIQRAEDLLEQARKARSVPRAPGRTAEPQLCFLFTSESLGALAACNPDKPDGTFPELFGFISCIYLVWSPRTCLEGGGTT